MECSWWRRTGGQYIGDIILGANDGIITTFAVVAGVVGARLPAVVVLLLGFANLVGDGISMGASNYLALRSAAAVNGARVASRRAVRRRALRSALATFVAFLVAGTVPLLAYLLPIAPQSAFWVAIVLTGIALFSVGASRALIIPRPWWMAGLEMFMVGALAALAAYLVGRFVSLFTGTVAG